MKMVALSFFVLKVGIAPYFFNDISLIFLSELCSSILAHIDKRNFKSKVLCWKILRNLFFLKEFKKHILSNGS
jgi:hypothetical protein